MMNRVAKDNLDVALRKAGLAVAGALAATRANAGRLQERYPTLTKVLGVGGAAFVATCLCLYLMAYLIANELSNDVELTEAKFSPPHIVTEIDPPEPPMRARAEKHLPAEAPPAHPQTGPLNMPMMEVQAIDPIEGSLADLIGPINIQLELPPPTADITPLALVQPHYPLAAEMREIEGYVLVSFTVRENGTVANAVVLDSEPEVIFDQAALSAVSRSKFRPRNVGGDSIAVDNVQMKFAFTLSSLYEVPPGVVR